MAGKSWAALHVKIPELSSLDSLEKTYHKWHTTQSPSSSHRDSWDDGTYATNHRQAMLSPCSSAKYADLTHTKKQTSK